MGKTHKNIKRLKIKLLVFIEINISLKSVQKKLAKSMN